MLTQVVSEPTHETPSGVKSLIDLIFLSHPLQLVHCDVSPPLGTSDHNCVNLGVSTCRTTTTNSTKVTPRLIWRYSLADWDRAAELLDCIEWDPLLQLDINEHWRTWRTYFLQVMELCMPHTAAKVRKGLPWISKEILNAIKKRDILFRTAKATGKPADRAKYNQKRNQVVHMLRDGKQHFFDQHLNNVDAKTFWKTIRLLNQECSSSRIPALQDIDGAKIINSNLDKATTLNKFFYICFNHSQSTLMDPPMIPLPPDECPAELLCTEESVFELLSNLDTTKSTGCDGISSKMLKCTSLSIADPLHKLYNHSISTGTIPADWKIGRITPIPKGTNDSLPSGYRPISVLPIVSKLIERHIIKTIVEEFL